MTADASSSWRLAKADRFLRAAERGFEAEDWETAVSRAYYAAYHAAIAVLETRFAIQTQRWDHLHLQRTFRERFARRGFLFTVREAESLERLHEARLVADYEEERFTLRSTRRLVDSARNFCDRVREVVRDA